MKINNIFAAVYSIVLIATAWFGIDWMITRGVASMFDNWIEFALALLFVGALTLSILMHVKLNNRRFSLAHKVCAVVTSVNCLLLSVLAIAAVGAHTDAGLLVAACGLGILALWFVSLVFGVIALNVDKINAEVGYN